MLKTFATFLQYLLPFVFGLGALMSLIARSKRASLHCRVASVDSPTVLDGMSWSEFEMLVGEAYRRQGYDVRELGGDGPDGGVDLVLTKPGEKLLVQCKQWKAFKVGVKVVRELYGVMTSVLSICRG
jgi:restriction system protein